MRFRGANGFTLIDTMIGIGLLGVAFSSIAAGYAFSIDLVLNDKARTGAIALAEERMEFLRSQAFSDLGTVGGIPSGTIAQSETVTLNGVTFTRTTSIFYKDDPKDGSGGSDTNAIVEDYKSMRVDVAWTSRAGGTRHVTLATRATPVNGMESDVPGGQLSITAANVSGTPIANASISIVNAGVTPAVNISTLSDNNGNAYILGVPTASGYQISVSKSGYSTSQTYSTTATNTNPTPSHLTITNNQTTSGTFLIDLLASKVINTWTPIVSASWPDDFLNSTLIATSSQVVISSGSALLSGPPYATGFLQSNTISPSLLATWLSVTWLASSTATTSVKVHILDGTTGALVSDSEIPGNSVGTTTGLINLASLSTSTHPSIALSADLITNSTTSTPSLNKWTINYMTGPTPLGNVPISVIGAKTIGSGPGGTIYKYSTSTQTNNSGNANLSNIEWDDYTVSVTGSTYDVRSACNPQPESLAPGGLTTTNLFLATHTANSLLVDTRFATSGALVANAYVTITRAGFTATSTTDTCGQAFFSGLTSAANYTVAVGIGAHATTTTSSVNVSGTSRFSTAIN